MEAKDEPTEIRLQVVLGEGESVDDFVADMKRELEGAGATTTTEVTLGSGLESVDVAGALVEIGIGIGSAVLWESLVVAWRRVTRKRNVDVIEGPDDWRNEAGYL